MQQRLLAALDLVHGDDDRLRVRRRPAITEGREVVFGGELLGQAIVAAGRAMPTKRVRSVQTIFARAASHASPVELDVEVLHEGRNLGSASVSVVQGDRLCARMLVLLDTEEPDLIRHGPAMPDVPAPDAAAAGEHPLAAPETIVVGEVDVGDPAATGPARLQLWIRFPGVSRGDPTVARALLAHATDGWLIATAMRPHDGLGQSMAHREVSTGVLSHALSFHEDPDVDRWLLIDHHGTYAGGGRCYGRADVFTEHGRLVASFSQEALLRRFPSGVDPTGRAATIL